MTGSNDTVLVQPTSVTPGMFASTGGNGCGDETLHHLHNNNAIWNSGAFNTAAMDRFGYAILQSVEHNGRDNIVETTRQSMATQLAVEKIGAAQALAICNSTRELQLQAETHNASVLRQLAECCCELKEGQAATNALIRSVEADRIRDELANLKQELTLSKILGSVTGGILSK